MAITRELPVLGSKAWSFDDYAQPLVPSRAAEIPNSRKPEWIRVRPPAGESYLRIRDLMRSKKLHTVCEEARCPNVAECWQSGTATFLIGGDICTRACRFCAVKTARRPPPLDPEEPQKIASNVTSMGLSYVVLTSVDRDDLDDQGAGHFAATIRGLKQGQPELLVEALVPDFRGEPACIHTIVESGLDVYAHNIETVRRLQLRVRDPRAGYEQSLLTLQEAKRHAASRGQRLVTKSSIMLGLGETEAELIEAFQDLRKMGVEVLTLGQYLRPTAQHLPVEEFVTPEKFSKLEIIGLEHGFAYVAAGPMVRSSYRAAEFFVESMLKKHPPEGEMQNGV